ncbi:HupE/UreJ family protein [Pseudokineococcus sp. 1T1Z-3]|uniref:HupE/UreJ family protein n=1 Tax=Pseudokineococcus sp. 1T1Z-3 TaxID=3132745 RepID=UPI0030B0AAE1
MTTTPRRLLAAGALAAGLALLPAAAASAHSLDSSTISVVLSEDSAQATVSVAAETLEAALAAQGTSTADAAAVTDYLAEHLSVTGADGTEWAETWSDPVVGTVEGLESVTAQVTFDTGGADPADFALTYDAVIEADPTHEAVVVLTDADGDISTAGTVTATDPTLEVGDAAEAGTGLLDMLGYGFHHVLEGADHLLFVTTLLLVAPLVVVGGRWVRRDGVLPALQRVVGVVTAFTVGHSLTLMASALGWVSLPTVLTEVLVAVSVGVAAVHAIRPLARRGEVLIAGGFGLVHGLAFAGILTDLGLEGTTSVPALLAFNVGVELAQLLTVAVLFPSLYLISRTRAYPVVRTAVAGLALAAATGWVLDRLGLLANPLAGLEEAAIGHPWWVVAGFAVLALTCWAAWRPTSGAVAAGSPGPPVRAGAPDAGRRRP